MIIEEKINNCNICYSANYPIHIKEYYNYCVKLLKQVLRNIDSPLNILMGGKIDWRPKSDIPILKIDVQCEHTLVKEGGRGVGRKIFGKVKTNEEKNYLVRIDQFEYLNSLNFIIEYSLPNIFNIKESGLFDNYLKKIIYIAPSIYDSCFDKDYKTETITLFTSNESKRRSDFYHKMTLNHTNCINVDDCYSEHDLKNRYKKTRIMVNVHQTDHHHTFEELRVLPALCNGVIVISESVPLKELIPYNKSIIWSDYENLAKTTMEVQKNYNDYYKDIFNDELYYLLEKMRDNNINNLKRNIFQ